ncbi:MAG: hypothetical protein HY698_11030 [Deltaproteobacteria bacterium]|nr:hypothetical protein [Deltaproteobacteria bacterium]
MTARRILAIEALEESRRRASVGGAAAIAMNPWLLAGAWGALLGALLVVAREAGGPEEARTWWLIACGLASAGLVMRTPWRFFWRSDAVLLGRLPIEGRALFLVGTWRGARTAMRLALGLGMGFLALLPGATAWLASLLVMLVSLGCSTMLAPAVAAAAGAIVSSEKVRIIVSRVTGFGGAKVGWLWILPGAGGVIMLLLLFALARKAPSLPLVTVALSACTVAWFLGERLSRSTMQDATREIAALDRVMLAHVDLVSARGLEAAWGRLLGRNAVIYCKDVAIHRRRYPAYYLLCGLEVVALWLFWGLSETSTAVRWTLGLAVTLGAHGALLGWRLVTPPVEHGRLMATLPFSRDEIVRSKRHHVTWRVVVPMAIGTAPFLVAQAGGREALGLLGIVFSSLFVGWTAVAALPLLPGHKSGDPAD